MNCLRKIGCSSLIKDFFFGTVCCDDKLNECATTCYKIFHSEMHRSCRNLRSFSKSSKFWYLESEHFAPAHPNEGENRKKRSIRTNTFYSTFKWRKNHVDTTSLLLRKGTKLFPLFIIFHVFCLIYRNSFQAEIKIEILVSLNIIVSTQLTIWWKNHVNRTSVLFAKCPKLEPLSDSDLKNQTKMLIQKKLSQKFIKRPHSHGVHLLSSQIVKESRRSDFRALCKMW